MGLKEDFDAAADKIKNLKAKPSDEELLEIYGLFKQATVGDNNTDKPGMLDFKGKAKWESWNGKKGLSKDEAMTKYIEKANELVASLGVN